MTSPKENQRADKSATKAAKKAAKAEAKAAKKLAVGQTRTVQQPAAGRASGDTSEARISPAERAARAAERQVLLQRRRVWIAFLTALIGLATLIATLAYRASLAPVPTAPTSQAQRAD